MIQQEGNMSEQPEKQPLNTWLDNEQAAQFNAVKTYLGMSSNSEVVRFLIRQEYRRITAENPAQPILVATEAC